MIDKKYHSFGKLPCDKASERNSEERSGEGWKTVKAVRFITTSCTYCIHKHIYFKHVCTMEK